MPSQPYATLENPETIQALKRSKNEHYKRNKEKYIAQARAKQEQLKHFLQGVKSYPCTDCDKSYPSYVMDFDHRPEEAKLKEVGRLVQNGSWTKLIEEIMKCDLVCSNCHRERTYQRSIALVA